MTDTKKIKSALVTGSAGFIGFHISKRLLKEGWRVIGLDCMTDYYDLSLKKGRERILSQSANFHSLNSKLEEPDLLKNIFEIERPEIVIHLAAQAGVRYSIENPRAYLESNILGTFELLEAARSYPPKHLLMASTSSTYGANKEMPYKETAKVDTQMSFYAATKKSNENMAHSYAHLFCLPITMLRFFTVYGPWGRPDMALFKFTKAILNGEKIDVFNHGKLTRDFTYIDDIVEGIRLLIDVIPRLERLEPNKFEDDNISPVAPFRVINIGNSKPEKLIDFIEAIEISLGMKADKNFLPMQPGDVASTWADTKLFEKLTRYKTTTDIQTGVSNFVAWYRKFYNV